MEKGVGARGNTHHEVCSVIFMKQASYASVD